MKQATLNHVFRLVWSDRLQSFVPVAETERRGRRGASIRRRLARAALGALLVPALAWADGVKVAPGSGGTRVYQAPNGVTVVDIDKANGQGLSHNKYLDYNVNKKGLVLNNGSLANGTQQQSQLAGQILSNANLDKSARVILNEVVAANRSQLSGFTEVVGDKADVVLANQYGITCNGCGFINTDRVTLTTGRPDIRNGVLQGFNVERGQILIHGQGLNATNQDYFDLVARSVKLDGMVNARDLRITAGASDWDYASREASAVDGDEPAPELALDSTALGGMYADRIYIHATESGVGVRMLGDAAASGADFRLTAAGQIEVGGDISAQRDVALATSQSGQQALVLNNARISAKRDASLHATGEARLTGGTLTADGTFSANVGSLNDQASQTQGEFNNQRYGAAGVAMNISGNATLNGTGWTSDGAQQWTLASLDVAALGTTLYGDTVALTATDAGLALGDAKIIANQDLSLRARQDITTGDGEEQAISSRDGDVRIDTDTTLNNQGHIVAGGNTSPGNVTVNAKEGVDNQGTLAGTGDTTVATDGLVDNSGILGGNGATTVRGRTGARASALDNQGKVQSGDVLTVQADSIRNRDDGLMLSTKGADIDGNALNNSGELIAANLANSVADLNLRTLRNTGDGILQSAGGLSITIGDTLQNFSNILAYGDITVRGASAGYQLINSGALQSGATLCITGIGDCQGSAQARSGVDLTLQAESMLKGRDINLQADAVTLNGDDDKGSEISSERSLILAANTLKVDHAKARLVGGTTTTEIDLNGGLENSGAIHSHGDLAVSAQRIDNSDTAGLSAADNLTLNTDADIDNAGSLYAGGVLNMTARGNIINHEGATIHSGDNAGGVGDIVSQSVDFTNYGEILSLNDITLNVERSFVNETRFDGQSIDKTLGDAENPRDESEIKIANEGGADSGMNVWVVEDRITRRESLSGDLTEAELTNRKKAQILSTGNNGTLTVNYGESGLNRVAVLSASNVVLKTSNDQAVFTNESLTLYRYDYTRRWIEFGDEKIAADNYLGVWARTDPDAPIADAACENCGDVDDDQYVHDNWSPGAGWEKVGGTEQAGRTRPSDALVQRGRDAATDGAVRDDIAVEKSFGAGIFATNLQVEGGSLNNEGSPYQDAAEATSGNPLSGNVVSTGTNGANGINLGNYTGSNIPLLPITLPDNPNGYFVTSQDPQADYLVETNSLYTSGNLLGSDFLADQLGLDLDQIGLRLGDAGYEAFLIRQQLLNETGNNRLSGYADEQSMIESLYASSGDQAGTLGLTWGEPLSEQQVANLDQDMIWMVEREVDGQTVLAPQVYLSEATRQSINDGAVIAADNTFMDVENLTNNGGTLSGSNTLVVESNRDITNIGGDISGGNVYLTAQGDITNQTVAEGAGDDTTYRTVLGKTGSIVSNNDLLLSAENDIRNQGADLSANGTAIISAGNDIVVDTIENKTTTTRYSESGNSRTTTTRGKTRHIGSNLDMGGDMLLESGNDTTIAASDVSVGGNMATLTGGSYSLESRQDQDTTHTEKREEGFGVAGGLYGERDTTTDDFTGTNNAANLNVGGDALIDSGEDIKIQGANVDVGGNAALRAENDIDILDGLDERRTTTKTETMTVFSTDTGSSSASKTDASTGTGPASAEASASASSEAGNESALNFYKTTETNTEETSTTSVASSLNVGGNLDVDAGNDLTIRGSDVTSKGLSLAGRDINVLAGENTHSKTTNEKSFAVGVFVDSGAQAEAGADATATGMTANAKANADASAQAETTATLGVQDKSSHQRTDSLTHSASTLNATGGSVTINAREDATFKGSEVNAAGNIDIDAKNIRNLAAEDRHSQTSSSTTQTGGLYVSGTANAEASGNANANVLGGGVKGKAAAGTTVGAGLRYGREESSGSSGSTTSQVNSFTAGDDVTRNADNLIHDQGTQITAGGDIQQSATTLKDEAAANTSWSTSSDTTHEARLGVTGEAGIEANAGAQGGVGADSGVKVEPTVGAGITASYDYQKEDSDQSSSQAVTSRYQAGGDISSTTSGETSLEGTRMQAKGDLNLAAESLNYKAAANTTSKSGSVDNANAGVKVDVAEKSVDLSAGYDQNNTTESSSEAVAGSLMAGGNVNIQTTNDTTLEGTAVSAGDNIDVASRDGDINLLAAESTQSSSSEGYNVGVEASISKKKPGGSVSGGYNTGEASATQRSGVTLTSNSGDINLSSGGDTIAEGAKINARDGKAGIKAGGQVVLKEAVNEQSSKDGGFQAGIKVSKKQQSFDVGVAAGETDSRQGDVTSISAREVTIEGNKVVDQEAHIDSNKTSITGPVEKQARTNKKTGYDIALDINGSRTKGKTMSGRKKTPTTSNTNTNNGNGTSGTHSSGGNNGTTGGSTSSSGANASGNSNSASSSSSGSSSSNTSGSNGTASSNTSSSSASTSGTSNSGSGSGSGSSSNNNGSASAGGNATNVSSGAGTAGTSPTNNGKKKKRKIHIPVNLPGNPGGGAPEIEMPDGQPVPEGIAFDPATGAVTGSLPSDYQGPKSMVLRVPQRDGSTATVEVDLNR
ncbi:hemagglutinin repeat-containing protein [Alloalcanivorax mobilis]|uniref:hemagglutinin repeat-containing protein n=1 Tax=Alloalcanivorax mobilis TaxID=2019569 RepID=UPI000C76F6ED|nr:hemagglutinin repeat-containing protein [Alloalcanivorax mobilis]